ncbi:branched-chain alpha-keto acid dehydrogenase subunit E2 [Paenibacillus darwinianus]|uniref:Dihydrolipoamide acetyltransferase component of pyruvate dehydrogenase complex n=1 Tax=Paenibacillus darwinianus TaxID=1380763 RepID=A0A9W5W842_9BACL|nr:dihydrolipoamide acetyltransferase family protein [Paenibacillus darwinianus]EXX86916.1 branched-chain alpha-keto acid dehydrogenase subunit E2 [Paenibacillus darwinianus]EXX90665.1 branched-chain alpha-keto acid dehydrogenase subunit E2 [Paenibacillus darwinianus]EXX91621.1 branched-chain alpha-keto acid dehydrogenase subunit E2 [Paenibacillus darwinianus]
MLNEVFMPKLGMTMETGTIIQWFKNEGDPVKQGEVLLEVMTDKINIEVEAYHTGILLKKYYAEDSVVPVNLVIGYIGEASDQAPDAPPLVKGGEETEEGDKPTAAAEVPGGARQNAAVPEYGKPRATPAARKSARERGVELRSVPGSGENGRIHKADVENFASESGIRATPLARRVAEDRGVDLVSIAGSGERGKVLHADVEQAAVPAATAGAETAAAADRMIKLQGMRKIIATRMSQSAFTAPHVTITATVDMTNVQSLRAELLPEIEKQTGNRLSHTEIIVKAAAVCLGRHPSLNARWSGEAVVLQPDVNIGLAVAVKDGLLVPVIQRAQTLGLADLVRASKELAAKARDNRLKPEDFFGGTFTISNLGKYAVDSFNPIINQPEVAILGVGQIQDRPVVKDGQLAVAPVMTLNLSFDHRVIDGAPAAAFLTELKNVLEKPFQLLI